MNRRTILKQLAMATTAAMLIPSCVTDPKKVSIAMKNLDVNGDDEDLLAAIADTLIPATDKPGAKGTAAHLYALVMIDDCTDKETKGKFMKGLRSFDDACKSVNGKTFTKSNTEERVALLKHIGNNEKSFSEDINEFYSGIRWLMIEGYTGSQYFLTEVKPYQLVPGPDFKGCVPVTPNA
jgi:hypothetical protein